MVKSVVLNQDVEEPTPDESPKIGSGTSIDGFEDNYETNRSFAIDPDLFIEELKSDMGYN